jgi:hypothetical protein
MGKISSKNSLIVLSKGKFAIVMLNIDVVNRVSYFILVF